MATFYRKKIVCFLTILSCILLQGCTKPGTQDAEILSHDVTYEGKDVVLQGMEGDVVQYRMKGESLYVLTCAQEKSHLYRAATEGGMAEEIPFSGDGCIRCFYVDGEGSIYCLVSAAADGGLTGLVKLDADGKTRIPGGRRHNDCAGGCEDVLLWRQEPGGNREGDSEAHENVRE